MISKHAFSTEDVGNVRIVVEQRVRPAAMDVRLVDLRIRPPNHLTDPPPVAAVTTAKAGSKGWWIAGGLFGLLLTVALLVGLGVWLSQDADRGTAPVVSLTCRGCGKRLKAKAELAGKKVKCSGCGQAVVVPKAEAAVVGKGRSLAFKGWLLALVGAAFLGLVLLPLGVWLFWPARPAAPSFMNVPLGNQTVPGVEDSGLYDEEYASTEGIFRWTNGKATLAIPLDRKDLPRALRVQLYPPKGISHRIIVNGQELANEQPSDRDMRLWDRTLDLSGVELGEKLVLEIVSNTLVSSEVQPGRTNDGRSLGVAPARDPPAARESR